MEPEKFWDTYAWKEFKYRDQNGLFAGTLTSEPYRPGTDLWWVRLCYPGKNNTLAYRCIPIWYLEQIMIH